MTGHQENRQVHPDDDPHWTREERRIADYLRCQQHIVSPGGETQAGRWYDFTLDHAVPAEGKTLTSDSDSSTMRNRARESIRNRGQATCLIFDNRGSRMNEQEALKGVARIAGLYGSLGLHGRMLDRIIVIDDEYYIDEEI